MSQLDDLFNDDETKEGKMEKLSESVYNNVMKHYVQHPSNNPIVNNSLQSLDPEKIRQNYSTEIEYIVNQNYNVHQEGYYMTKLSEAIKKDIEGNKLKD